MSAHKHTPGTPGKWFVGQKVRDGSICVVGDIDSVVCEFGERLGGVEADARLIAAAPELLEALNKLTSFVVTDVVESCNGNKCREPWCAGCFGEEVAEQTIREAQEALDAARAAIAKATGEPA